MHETLYETGAFLRGARGGRRGQAPATGAAESNNSDAARASGGRRRRAQNLNGTAPFAC